jgi:hypothetical protein
MEKMAEKIKVGMAEAAATMSALLHQMDDDGAADKLLNEYFTAAENLQHAITRRKYLLGETKMRREMLSTTGDEIRRQIASLDRVADRINESTAEIIMSNPDIVFRDDLGKKVYVANNSKSTINYSVATDKRTITNIVSEAEAQKMGYYAKPVTVYVVDSERVRKDLENGIAVPFATEILGCHLRGM